METTIFSNLYDTTPKHWDGLKTISDVMAVISDATYGSHSKSIITLRRLYKNQDCDPNAQKKYKRLKETEIPVFSPSVIFEGGKATENIKDVTGLVHFDIDHNPSQLEIDLEELKEAISQIPECLYCFVSPSGMGLKFAIKTDFKINQGDEITVTKKRYEEAYFITKDYVMKACAEYNPHFDDNLKQIAQSCLFSYDPLAYYNANAKIYHINELCIYQKPQNTHSDVLDTVTFQQVAEYLRKKVPSHIRRSERFPYVAECIHALGPSGIDLVVNHWADPDKKKLKKQAEDIYRQLQSDSIRTNSNRIIAANSTKRMSPIEAKRISQRAKPSNFNPDPLLAVDDAYEKLQKTIQGFFENNQNTLIVGTGGLGKSSIVQDCILNLSAGQKVLMILRDNKIAEEIEETYRAKQIKSRKTGHRVVHIRSKNDLCNNEKVRRIYKDNKMNHIPPAQCFEACDMKLKCDYIKQYNLSHDETGIELQRLRIMMFNEIYNENSSAFFNGIDHNGFLITKSWVPDYIVVDEDILKFAHEDIKTHLDEYLSLQLVRANLAKGMSLAEAIKENAEIIYADYNRMIEQSERTHQEIEGSRFDLEFDSEPDFHCKTLGIIKEAQEKLAVEAKQSNILETMYYWLEFEGRLLEKLYVYKEDNGSFNIIYNGLQELSERWGHIPILFLDATANIELIQILFPDLECHTIHVKKKTK